MTETTVFEAIFSPVLTPYMTEAGVILLMHKNAHNKQTSDSSEQQTSFLLRGLEILHMKGNSIDVGKIKYFP